MAVTRYLEILGISGRGVKVRVLGEKHPPFWLPLHFDKIRWSVHPSRLQPGKVTTAAIPNWLAKRHRQLCGDDEYERHKFEECGIVDLSAAVEFHNRLWNHQQRQLKKNETRHGAKRGRSLATNE